MSDEGPFWFNLNTHQVEGTEGARNADRLGPYDTRAEAERALKTVEERNEAWDNDPKWKDD